MLESMRSGGLKLFDRDSKREVLKDIIAIEYDYKELDPILETAINYFNQKNYKKSHSKFAYLTKCYPKDDINHRLAEFYIERRIKSLISTNQEECKNNQASSNSLKG